MEKLIFVNLPIESLAKSVSFFSELGYEFNPQFTSDDSTCMIISDHIFAMFLETARFETFIDLPVADAHKSKEVLVALNLESREAVDAICEKAFALGARRYKEPDDHGFMYGWGFQDLDGHIWEYFWMDPSHVLPASE